MKRILILLIFIAFQSSAANYPTSFSNAKKKSEKHVYFDHLTTFYCGCDYVFDDTVDRDGDGNRLDSWCANAING